MRSKKLHVLAFLAVVLPLRFLPAGEYPRELMDGPGLTWKTKSPDGHEIVQPQLADKNRKLMATVEGVTSAGAKVITPLYALDEKVFRGHAVYYSEFLLPAHVKPTFVNLIFSGTPGSTPDNGSIINIDGAILGLKLTKSGTADARAEVMVMSLSKSGQPEWSAAQLGLALDDKTGLTSSPKLGVRLDAKANCWALYFNGILIRKEIPLFAGKKRPASTTISIRAGLVDTDLLILKKVSFGYSPDERQAGYLPVDPVTGKVDYAKAVREHDKRLQAPGFSALKLMVSGAK